MTSPYHEYFRAGDVLHVTTIGAYTLWEGGRLEGSVTPPNFTKVSQNERPKFIEVNSLPIDAAFADDGDEATDKAEPNLPDAENTTWENVGRMTPLFTTDMSAGTPKYDVNGDKFHGYAILNSAKQLTVYHLGHLDGYWNDYEIAVYNENRDEIVATNKQPWFSQIRTVTAHTKHAREGAKLTLSGDLVDGNGQPLDPSTMLSPKVRIQIRKPTRYGWASDLLEYVTTIHSPADDYLPARDPEAFTAAPVRNNNFSSSKINRSVPAMTEDDIPIEGLMNINTAGWKALSTLPMVIENEEPNSQEKKNKFASINWTKNEQLARNIVYFRDVDDGSTPGKKHPHGPFKSLFELLLVPGFRDAMGTLTFPKDTNHLLLGDFSPTTGDNLSDGIRGDFEERFMALNRISNLITLRSDAFTAYVQVQGWRGAGTSSAELVVQRRLAFIVDRSHLMPNQKIPLVHTVPVGN